MWDQTGLGNFLGGGENNTNSGEAGSRDEKGEIPPGVGI